MRTSRARLHSAVLALAVVALRGFGVRVQQRAAPSQVAPATVCSPCAQQRVRLFAALEDDDDDGDEFEESDEDDEDDEDEDEDEDETITLESLPEKLQNQIMEVRTTCARVVCAFRARTHTPPGF